MNNRRIKRAISKKVYCTRCGALLEFGTEFVQFSSKTGKKLYCIFLSCPNNNSRGGHSKWYITRHGELANGGLNNDLFLEVSNE